MRAGEIRGQAIWYRRKTLPAQTLPEFTIFRPKSLYLSAKKRELQQLIGIHLASEAR